MTAPRLVGPWLLLAVGVTVSVLAIVLDQVRLGGLLLAATFAITAAARLLLPSRAAGALAVRSRTLDVLGLCVAAAACAALTLSLNLRS